MFAGEKGVKVKALPPARVYVVEQYIHAGPSRSGHWYECRRVRAANSEEARRLAFPDGIPEGYRLNPA